MVYWGLGFGATTQSHLGLNSTGNLCTAISSARHLQRRSTSSDKRDLWQWKTESDQKWPINLVCDSDSHVNRKVLLHAANLRHGTDGFTSPPNEGMLWIFSRAKNPTTSAGFEPAIGVPGASMLTTRPPKPLWMSGATSPLPICLHGVGRDHVLNLKK
jgi:hypothetical protein